MTSSTRPRPSRPRAAGCAAGCPLSPSPFRVRDAGDEAQRVGPCNSGGPRGCEPDGAGGAELRADLVHIACGESVDDGAAWALHQPRDKRGVCGLIGTRSARSGLSSACFGLRRGVSPRSVVYLSKPGQFARIPASVRNLPQVTHFAVTRGSELNTATLVVIHPGILLIISPDAGAATRRGQRAKAAQAAWTAWNACPDRNFCLWSQDDWEEAQFNIHGPTWVGTGWHNFPSTYNDVANSQVNRRELRQQRGNLVGPLGKRGQPLLTT
jgi:hypothetical protein